MTVESNDVITIATLSDWLKDLHGSFSTNEKQNQNQSCHLRVIFPMLMVRVPGEKPQRIFEDRQGSLKTCKDLQKIFEDEDLSRILKGSLKDL